MRPRRSSHRTSTCDVGVPGEADCDRPTHPNISRKSALNTSRRLPGRSEGDPEVPKRSSGVAPKKLRQCREAEMSTSSGQIEPTVRPIPAACGPRVRAVVPDIGRVLLPTSAKPGPSPRGERSVIPTPSPGLRPCTETLKRAQVRDTHRRPRGLLRTALSANASRGDLLALALPVLVPHRHRLEDAIRLGDGALLRVSLGGEGWWGQVGGGGMGARSSQIWSMSAQSRWRSIPGQSWPSFRGC